MGATSSRRHATGGAPFPSIEQCSSHGRDAQTVVSDLDGTLLRGRSSFPYFFLVAYEASGLVRAAALLVCAPLAWLLYHWVSEAAGVQVLVFVALAGVRVADVESVARAVLPKFYADDLHPETWRVFSSFGKRYVLTANPRIMVEPFAKEYLLADAVLGTEIDVTPSGRATGFLKPPGILVGAHKLTAMDQALGPGTPPDCGLGDRRSDWPFLARCREAYLVPPSPTQPPAVADAASPRLAKPVVFHDGRLARRPTPGTALLTLLWLPVGAALAVVRVAAGALLPVRAAYHAFRLLGVPVHIRGTPPSPGSGGLLFVCSHRTLLDPVFLATALGRPVTALTYSISRVSELLSPIPTARLTRDRAADARLIRALLAAGRDVVICPEGTTCREPFLLRFSALFAELADRIVPVAMAAASPSAAVFHATTARGWKGLDSFYFFMNPRPAYSVTFLEEVPRELTCAGGGRPAHEVAEYVQRVVAAALGFECTNLTRRDKYWALAGNDGSVPARRSRRPVQESTAAAASKFTPC